MHIFCIHHILKKKWEYKEVVEQFFIDLKKAYYSVRRKVFILFGIPMKLVSQCNLQQGQVRQTFIWQASYYERFEERICFTAAAFQTCFTVCD